MNNLERPIVAKFGGSSMAEVSSILEVTHIIRSNPQRRIIVVSAPGVNTHHAQKITDLLEIASTQEGCSTSNGLSVHREHQEHAWAEVSQRFSEIGRALNCIQPFPAISV